MGTTRAAEAAQLGGAPGGASAGSWRAALVPSLAIPVSLFGALAIIWLAGFSLNTLSLMALIVAAVLVVLRGEDRETLPKDRCINSSLPSERLQWEAYATVTTDGLVWAWYAVGNDTSPDA